MAPALVPALINALAAPAGPSGMIGGQVGDMAGENHALSLLRSGEITTFPTLRRRVIDDVRQDTLTSQNNTSNGTSAELSARRLDQWLWFARLLKSRSLAARLCAGGAVLVNEGVVGKASPGPGHGIPFHGPRPVRER